MPNNVILPEVGTKCIYPVLDAQKIQKYCIQQDGNIIDTPNQKVLQTKGNTYYLEHSTDTNAINSFYGATIIGICFAVLATWLAWWCAKRSFDLTTKSFKVTIRQIRASILAAEQQNQITLTQLKESAEASERQTQLTITSNTNLITHQEKVNLQSIKANSRQNWINTVREHAIEFIYQIDEFSNLLVQLENSYYKGQKTRNLVNMTTGIDLLKNNSEDIHKKCIQFNLFLNPNDKFDIQVLNSAKKVDELIQLNLKNLIDLNEEMSTTDEITKLKVVFERSIQKILKEEWEKIKIGE